MSRRHVGSAGVLPRRRARQGGTAPGDAVTLLLIVAVLAVFVWVQVQRARERASIATMTGDLQRFALHQESSRRDYASYSPDVSVVEARGFRRSEGVQIDVREATSQGWSAVASHRATRVLCYVFVGEAAPLGVAWRAGEVHCV